MSRMLLITAVPVSYNNCHRPLRHQIIHLSTDVLLGEPNLNSVSPTKSPDLESLRV